MTDQAEVEIAPPELVAEGKTAADVLWRVVRVDSGPEVAPSFAVEYATGHDAMGAPVWLDVDDMLTLLARDTEDEDVSVGDLGDVIESLAAALAKALEAR